MTIYRLLSLLAFAILWLGSYAAPRQVMMLNLDREIGSTTWRYTEQAINQATRLGSPENPALLLVRLSTYGGEVSTADSIRTAIMHYPGPTVAWIDNNAASAGALIALACDSVVMRPDAAMGAATVVSGADGTAMPDKYQSYMRGMMRATAEAHGRDTTGRWRRDPLIAEAMVDHRIAVPGLIDSTRVLTFTADEAIRWGYADAKASTLDEALASVGVNEYKLTRYRPTFTDRLIGFLTNPAVQAVLIMIIVGGIWFELQSPGMGFPSAAAIAAALLYFLPMALTGDISAWVPVLFVVGVILLLLEIFVIPGFGVCGITGIVAILFSLFWAMVEWNSTTVFDLSTLLSPVLTLMAGVAMAVVLALWLTSSRAPLWARRAGRLDLEQRVDLGYVGVDTTLGRYIGRQATTATDMRPSGKIMIGDERLDAISDTGFIAAGTTVKIVAFETAQLHVRPLE